MDNPEKQATQGTQDEDKTKIQRNMCWTLLNKRQISAACGINASKTRLKFIQQVV